MKASMKVDLVAYGLMLALGAGAFLFARSFPRAEEAYSGPGSFPSALGLALAILGLMGIYRAFRNPVAPDRESAQPAGGVQHLLGLGGMTAVYLIAMPHMGFISATALFFMGVIRFLGFRRWNAALAIGFLFAFGLYAIFGILMNVSLPKGWIG